MRFNFIILGLFFLTLSGCLFDKPILEKHEIVVDENGYTPEKIKITNPNTKKVQIDFKRITDSTCATEVVYEPQNINADLPLNETVTVVFDITKGNEITFGCAMDKMHKGVIVKQKSI